LDKNKLNILPNWLNQLSKLEVIICDDSNISDLSPLAGLAQLQRVDCDETQVSDLSPLAGLTQLQAVLCDQTQVSDLSPILPKLKKVGAFSYNNCPLITPPIEFANQGDQAVIEYFEQIEENSTKLNELKVIFLGEGASGKTSLIKRIRDKDFNPKEDLTHGIRIRKTDFKVEGDTIAAHLWDFGGQEVMHATHQFFLSKRCIYVLVLNSRTDDKAEYWLKHAASFGGNSPVLIVLNKIDENPSFDVNRKVLNEKYPQIKGYFPLSCQSEQGIDAFKQALLAQMALSDARRTPFPNSWLAIKKQFECMDDDYIESQRYQKICEQAGLDKPISQDVLLQFLHDLGLVINFRQLQNFDTQILNPLWLTNGVYRIINSEVVINNKGILHENKFDQVINDPRYKEGNTCDKTYTYPRDKLSYIVRIMQQFELCYPLDHESYVIPQLLPVAEPDFYFNGASIHFEMHFPEFLPDSVFPRLMVKLHQYIDNGLHWRTGMVLYRPLVFDAKARIRADKEDKKIIIDARGKKPRHLLSFIRATLKEIIKDFSKLDFKEMIAIPNDQGQVILRDYDEVVGLEEMEEKDVAIVELRTRVAIKDILDGVEEASMRDKEAQTPIKAFISYSHKDTEEGLQALKAALAPHRRLHNLELWCDHAIDAGDTWKKEIFKQLESADIVLCLISQDFINSDFCHQELETALENHHKGKQTVIPILWRHCYWEELPIASLQAASSDWIKSQVDMDLAWTMVAKGLKPVIKQAKKRRIEKGRESMLGGFR
jgi:internalin A